MKKKMLQSCICVLLVLCMCIGLVPAAHASSSRVQRYTVLVLDTEGGFTMTSNGEQIYEVHTPIEMVRQSAIKFVEQMEKASGINHVAVVTYGYNVTTQIGFTTDTDELRNAIQQITNDERGLANLNGALETADELLMEVDEPGAAKNVVLFTQGIAGEGEHTSNGLYSWDDCTWERSDNEVLLCDYANAACNTAHDMMARYYLYSIGLFQQFDKVPDAGRSLLRFAKRVAEELQNAGYTEVTNVEDLEFVFSHMAETIAQNFRGHTYQIFSDASSWEEAEANCERQGGHLACITSEAENDFLYDYMTTSGIQNAFFGFSDQETEGTWSWINLEKTAYTNWHEGEPNGGSAKEDYAMFFEGFTDGTWNDSEYTPYSDDRIYYICEWDNQFELFRDNNQYRHSNRKATDGFYGVKNYQLQKQFYEELKESCTAFAFDKHTIKTQMKNDWHGSCYGIAASMAMNFNQNYDVTKLSHIGAENYYSMELPYKNNDFLNVIQYYHLSQFLHKAQDEKISIAYYVNPEHMKDANGDRTLQGELEKIVKHCTERDNRVYILNLGYQSGGEDEGHSILVWGCIYITVDGGESYYELQAYDENDCYSTTLKISDDFQNFWINTGNGDRIGTCSRNGLSYSYNYIGLQDPDNIPAQIPSVFSAESGAEEMRLSLPSCGKYTITAPDGTYIGYDGQSFVGDMEIFSASPVVTSDHYETMCVYVNAYETLTLQVEEGEACISLTSDQGHISLTGTNVTQAQFHMGESMTVTGTDASFDAALTGLTGDDTSGLAGAEVGRANGSTVISTADGNLLVEGEQPLEDVVLYHYTEEDDLEETDPASGDRFYAEEDDFIPVDPYDCQGNNAVCPSVRFDDVAGYGDWAHKGIDFVLQEGLFNGTGATKFEPNTDMTRAMLVTVLWRYSGSPKGYTNQFSDVRNDFWYTDAIAWAADNGIVRGVGGNRFEPDEPVSREQIAVILHRYADYMGLDCSARADFSAYPDADEVNDWAVDSLRWAIAEQLITGIKSGSRVTLSPGESALRSQVATILMRFTQNTQQ